MTTYSIPQVLSIVPLPPNQVLYPSLVISLQVARKDSIDLLQSVVASANSEGAGGTKALIIGCVPLRSKEEVVVPSNIIAVKKKKGAQKDPLVTPDNSDSEDKSPIQLVREKALRVIGVAGDGGGNSLRPPVEDLFDYGTAARIIRLERLKSTGGYLVVLEGLVRFHLDEIAEPVAPQTYFESTITLLPASPLPSTSFDLLPALQSSSSSLLPNLSLPPLLTRRLNSLISSVSETTCGPLIDSLLYSLPSTTPSLKFADKLLILASSDIVERVTHGIEIISRLNEALQLKKRLEGKIEGNMSRRQREYLLLQQLEAIRQELEDLQKSDPSGIAPKSPFRGSSGGKREKGEEEEEEEDEFAEIEKKIQQKVWTEESKKVVTREFKRLQKMPQQGAEFGVIRNYLDVLLNVPWTESSKIDFRDDFIGKARKQLDEDHYGLDKIKKRLLEWLAVLRLQQESWEEDNAKLSAKQLPADESTSPPAEATSTAIALRDPTLPPTSVVAPPPPLPKAKAPILLLCGPPGVGKTSIAKSLASSMGREFYRISLGGVRDEAEIRGHRRTYVGALPGALVQALRKTGVNNPVILLDEIDKIGMSSTHGDPAAALLEVLDPEQNWSFQDHYLGIPLDLSNVLFIATANTLDTISDPLYDRMEPIELSGYVHDEKVVIARKYLIPKQLKANMLPPHLLAISDSVLMHLVTAYTREAGVRTLEREIGSVCRAKTVEYSECKDKAKGGDVRGFGYQSAVGLEDLERILGVERFEKVEADEDNLVGVSTGLAYQGSGNGGILYIESTSMPGSGSFNLTGQLGDVISESAQLAFAWTRSHAYELGIAQSASEDAFQNLNIHVHLPSGSIKKDGPSAGVAMVVAMVSLMRGITVLKGVAMTGEITLRGLVTPVGGIKEKILAAHRAGLQTLILPYKNQKDVNSDLPLSAKEDLKFIYVRTIWEALEVAFGSQLWDGVNVEKRKLLIAHVEARL